MKLQFSKEFAKALDKLSGKYHSSVVNAINDVYAAESVLDIPNCKKIESLNSVYRIRIGDRRAFFVLHIEIDGNIARFEYLLSRGEAYDKKNLQKLRLRDIASTPD